MKRWFLRDSIKAKVGLAALMLMACAGIMAGMHRPAQHDIRVQTAASLQSAAAPDTLDISEKPKIAVTKTEIVVIEEEVPFTTIQTYDGTLAKDSSVVRVEGRAGKKVVKTEVRTKDGIEVGRALISEEITVPPVTKVIAIGTKTVLKTPSDASNACDIHYTPCIKKSSRDLDCSDIGFQVLVVNIGEDPHGLDRDNDGIGCENYPQN